MNIRKNSKSVSKRFKVTSNKLILYKPASKSHLQEKKTVSRKKRLCRVKRIKVVDSKSIKLRYMF
uniref:Large ribosomal subunit protein bL35c n=1 Tax=Cyanidium caldarium TaxID=2771 RepID=RK35_CYACA|nr:50S ribosomal protein L35 [Cyanidium caldarium]Q9TLR9.1 RecName: Full=Large ribosomal subunit protein bL35c; AltName: Full=50S ribosomal protein L35, chloroplastic [Cyanidium caldarium]AAF12894.1 unknown [Cyanidium caldarium]WDB00135.1 50S ribosomal protein L35 [Cyanidium caldarium]